MKITRSKKTAFLMALFMSSIFILSSCESSALKPQDQDKPATVAEEDGPPPKDKDVETP